ncbi:MAG: archaellin/type IV pilin N-terminal domain-containing protein [archaeon]
MNKRGISPIIATILLIAFAVAIGAMIMSWTTNAVTTDSKCVDLPTEILNSNAFCKVTDSIIPRINIGPDEYTVCKDQAILLSQIATC